MLCSAAESSQLIPPKITGAVFNICPATRGCEALGLHPTLNDITTKASEGRRPCVASLSLVLHTREQKVLKKNTGEKNRGAGSAFPTCVRQVKTKKHHAKRPPVQCSTHRRQSNSTPAQSRDTRPHKNSTPSLALILGYTATAGGRTHVDGRTGES